MISRHYWVALLSSLALTFLAGCSGDTAQEEPGATDSTAAADTLSAQAEEPPVDPEDYIFEFELDSPAELAADRSEIYAWFPRHSDRIDFALKDVTHITFLRDLGLDQFDIGTPVRYLGGPPIGRSIRMNLPGNKTAFAFRFVPDTLSGYRAQGEGVLGLFGVHSSDVLGPRVDVGRMTSSTGRLGLVMVKNYIMGTLSCCELPPIFELNLYGNAGDTIGVVVTFNTESGKHIILVMGPNGARAYPGYRYTEYRTEGGEFHRDLSEYPYYIKDADHRHVNLFLGFGWRGRKSVTEPVLTARMF